MNNPCADLHDPSNLVHGNCGDGERARPTNRTSCRKGWVRCLWTYRWRSAFGCLIGAVVCINAVAFMHAWRMTHFVTAGTRTASPESLSVLQKVKVLLTGVTVPKPQNMVTPDSLALAFETYRFDGAAGELEAWLVPCDHKNGLVLMFHGYASCKAELLREAAAFHELGYATLMVDFRGSGGSTGYTTTVGFQEADDVAKAWEFAAAQWPDVPIVLFGQSMGSAAVLRAISVHDLRPKAVILECPFDRLLATVSNRFRAMRLPAIPLAQLLVFWGGTQHGFNGFRHNPADYAKANTAPTLMLQGSADPRVTLSQAQGIFDCLGGEKQFEAFAGPGHESYVACDRQHWLETVRVFLGSSD